MAKDQNLAYMLKVSNMELTDQERVMVDSSMKILILCSAVVKKKEANFVIGVVGRYWHDITQTIICSVQVL